jgi:putative ubiquitin-RnfH superfamily antitoxin RatB of RatAB toxin-antitoxin module
MPMLIDVELVCATPERQVLLAMQVAGGATVADVIAQSGIHLEFPDARLGELEFGIWGRLVAGDQVVRDGDRIEFYRKLRIDPREARRRLARAGRTMGEVPES